MVLIAIVLLVITLGMYLIIVGGNMNKSNEERYLEDEEQIRYVNYLKSK